jgi:hypothetical protein
MLAFPILGETILFGKVYTIPIYPELYLACLYGDDWHIPSNTHAYYLHHRNSGLVLSKYKIFWDNRYKIWGTKF